MLSPAQARWWLEVFLSCVTSSAGTAEPPQQDGHAALPMLRWALFSCPTHVSGGPEGQGAGRGCWRGRQSETGVRGAAVGSRWWALCWGHSRAGTSEDGGKEAVGQPKNTRVS